jgi:hypothetical protein
MAGWKSLVQKAAELDSTLDGRKTDEPYKNEDKTAQSPWPFPVPPDTIEAC